MKLKQTLYLIGLSYLVYKIYSQDASKGNLEGVEKSSIRDEYSKGTPDNSKLEEICWEEMSG